ncbi:SAM-dependent methyltransferase [Cyanobacterium aponinum UTEX 3222]|uniref:class I SAM-dependent methyltransferase n=1 Tax=Cyanobacterium aponinum TaxID=379064 RepID=UPI002B4C0B24|nr:SAM-dependent methyltransferase [Cyanobacterium aponinum]WRL40218.1 SAM-dependent methyltransferase [Cyanobacterium aponinum UTEX 3221]WRL43120.1 SAM-dependent methyltransferase [Cyanobacterium aponinum UTEX 3222]
MTNNKSNLLQKKIIELIDSSNQKKITFADYMNLCLYDSEYGYYNSENILIGKNGDFYTSTSLSSDFGELLAIQLEEFWRVMDKPTPFHLVEVGAGEGNLTINILNYLKTHYPDFFQSIEYIIIEKSEILAEKQKQIIKKSFNKPVISKWCKWEDIENNSLQGCIFSNELIDAFPVHLVEFNQGILHEVYLTNNEGNLTEVLGNLSTVEIEDFFKTLNINFSQDIYPEKYRTEVNIQALNWLKTVTKKLKKGYVLTIDYGYQGDKYYHPQRFQGTLKCYYQHRHHNNPYVNIGCQDITSHINFTALEIYGERYGLSNIAYTPQALFLMNLGLGDRISELSSGKIPIGEIIERRNQLHSLINPEGLGNFGILLQGKNLNKEQKNYSLKGFKY